MGHPNWQRLAKLGQLPEEKKQEYQFLEQENKTLKALVEALEKENKELKKKHEKEPKVYSS